MIELRTALKNLLQLHHPRVYYENAPSTAQYPYIVYNLPNSFDNEQQEVFNLDLDIWDAGTDTTALETLSSTLWKALNKFQYIDSEVQFTTHRANRLVVEDDDPDIKRRKLIFELRYFDRT